MTVRAKLHLVAITEHEWQGKTLRFETRYGEDIPENMRFMEATPWGEIEMNIDNPVALKQFELGKEYYVDFNPVD